MNTEKTMNVLLIYVIIASAIFFTVIIFGLINSIYNEEMSKPIEYSYKNFSEHDIELAMKFNGVQSVTITETECYFIRDNVKCNLFNDATIKYLYENKQKEVKK